MNSRERILATLDHREPDRVAIDFGGHRSSGIMAQVYPALRAALGLPPSTLYVYDFIQQLAVVEDDVLDAVGADVVEIGHDLIHSPDYWQDWTLADGTPCKIPAFIPVERRGNGVGQANARVVLGDEGQVICIQKEGTLFFEQTCFPLLGMDEGQEIEALERLEYHLDQIMWWRLGIPPAPAALDAPERIASARALRESTERAIYGTFGGNLLEVGEFAYRIDNFLMLLAAEPRRMHAFLDRLVEIHLRNLERYLGAVGEFIDVIGFADDLGMQTGPQISPRMYREFFQPRHRIMWSRAKELCPHLKVGVHSCGALYPLLRDMIDAGMDAVNPVQFTCRDMELPRLKREFGRDLTFWGGGADTQGVLIHGTPQQVRDHVRANVQTLAPGGGFVFQQVHNILLGVPPENIVAMFEAVRG